MSQRSEQNAQQKQPREPQHWRVQKPFLRRLCHGVTRFRCAEKNQDERMSCSSTPHELGLYSRPFRVRSAEKATRAARKSLCSESPRMSITAVPVAELPVGRYFACINR